MNLKQSLGLNPNNPPCGCPSVADVIRAELAQEPRPLCRTHDADALAAREADQLRREAQGRDAAAVDAIDRVKRRWADEDATREAAQAAQIRHRDLEAVRARSPLEHALAVATGAHVVPLNAPASAFSALAGMAEDTDPTTPFDAA